VAVVNVPTRAKATLAPPPPPAPPPTVAQQPPAPPQHFIVPPTTEARYVPNEVLVEIPAALSAAALRGIEQRLGLSLIASRDIALIGTHINRYRIAKGRSVPEIVRTLRAENRVGGAQPNYVFALQDDAAAQTPTPAAVAGGAAPAAPAAQQPVALGAPAAAPAPVAAVAAEEGDPLQYTIAILHLPAAHRLATGKGVRIAIIDSGVDATSAEIKGRIVASFDAVGGVFAAHSHGTAIAGAILAHSKLIGIAPDAQVIAIRAFTGAGKSDGAEGTSFHIVEGLDFAAAQNARIVNMSFAGPHDDLLARALEALRAKGVSEIAAAGNGGATSAPLYPGAEPGVIAVTATDAHGQIFDMANRGAYIAIAAPGVDILVPAPGDGVQIATGTSIAAAHVSGIAALALERYGSLSPDALINALGAGSRKPDPLAGSDIFGAGLIDAFGVVQSKAGVSLAPLAPVASAGTH
jgi:subtilisin family serine protease